MGEVVSLPDNASRHVSVAQEALAKKNYASAVAHLEKAYKEAPTFAVAKLLVPALNGNQQSGDAVPYISKYMEDFLQTAVSTQALFDTLLALPDYRFAWAVLSHVDESAQANYEAQIKAAQAKDLLANRSAIDALSKQLKHLGGFDAHTQEQRISDLGRLPRQQLIEAATPNLIDPDVHPAVRISLLDALTAVGAEAPVMTLGFHLQDQVTPADLPGVMNDPTLLAVIAAAKKELGDDNPDLQQATLEMLRFEVGYLYPFIDQTISDPAAFAHAYLHKSEPGGDKALAPVLTWLAEQTAKLMDMA